VTSLDVYRDDGPLAAWIARGLRARGRAAPAEPHPLAWLVPPLLRLVEYGSLIALTALAEPEALPACFTLLGVLALHHYDAAYRLSHRHPPPRAWVRAAGAGWEGRLLVAGGLAVAGFLGPGLVVAAVILGLAYAAESASSWIRPAEEPPGEASLADEGETLE
jgi:Family of unknown function (DUF5941)